jgi:hypothetical protein
LISTGAFIDGSLAKMLAIEQGTTSRDLLIQAVNLLFDHYNRPTIAG